MKYITFLIRKFLDSYRDSTKLVKFYNLKSMNGHFIWLKIFFIKFFYSFSFLRNSRKYCQIIGNDEEENFALEKKINIKKIIKDMDYQGHSNFFSLKKNFINDFKKIVLESTNHDLKKIPPSLKNDIFKKNKETNKDYLERIKSLGISRITGSINLNVNSSVSDLLLSDTILKLAKSYLCTEEITVSALYFISLPNNNLEEIDKIANAQYFHWDNDFTKFFKLYIYLSDVDENSGPHVFVPGTHKKKLFKHQLHRPFPDNDIYNSYPVVKSFLGNQGSSFFVDSYGLHKAKIPKNNNRIILNIHYGKGKIFYSKFDKFVKC